MRCAFCAKPVDPKTAWKGANNQFYCGEFCADAETPEDSVTPAAASSLIDLHRKRPYERLERLLPYMRAYSGRAMAARTNSVRPRVNQQAVNQQALNQPVLNRVA